ncbi:UNVERIFIED_ORG: Raf kinase inhibitor-like YbhB/YbcL family protein [Pseudomonas lini]|uniref:Kinase inhibitor n=1 Tax=Pseudomonas viciae TaxID=2505979 RepID=A0A4P7PIG3_9PSED|nr:kinase inhibitor [Pseudomonas viciae]QBZ90456.1 kinase inhibitor [Pseudomonas viciae]UZE84493.1 kinase inhibitor [Pseudomonas viciae]WGO91412.1 kinase inhibitor [Pseudomonas viciae]
MNIRLILPALSMLVSLSGYAADFSLTSQDIADNRPLTRREVFQGFGCEGGNTSPELSWANAPAGTRSYAITVYDPDAPTGSGWWHWTVFNLPASLHSLPSGAGSSLPAGAVQGRTDYGQSAFGGACPPVGDKPHRYQFTVWALKVDKLPLDSQASGALVGYMLNANALAKATITSTYGR